MRDLSVLLVDNNPLFTQLLTRFLQTEEKVHVTGISTHQVNVIQCVQEIKPDVVLIDLDSPLKNSLEMISMIRTLLPDAILIAMTLLDTIYYQKAVLEAGADDLILKMELNANFLIYLHSRLETRKRSRYKAAVAPVHGHLIRSL